mgnify:CR=1 FL=1
MAYRINENGDHLYNGTQPLFKAANDLGKYILNEIVKFNRNRDHVKVPLRYIPTQRLWVDARDRYTLFDVGTKETPEIIQAYLEGVDVNAEPAAVNVDGVLTTDQSLPISLTDGVTTIDVPTEAKTKKRQVDIDLALNPKK